MSKPLRNMNSNFHEIAKKAFEKLLLGGAFPKVEFVKGENTKSYSMIEYSTVWATFAKIAHKKLVEKGFEFGVWQNARNKKYLGEVTEVTSGITEEEVNNSEDRFRTMFG